MTNKDNYLFPKKNELHRIKLSDVEAALPDLKNSEDSKVITIGKWLGGWIKSSLSSGKISVHNVLPSKAEFAYHLGVSIGTVQNAFRYLEDLGYVESKQCIGTLISDGNSENSSLRKLTSKRDLAVESIKRYILNDGFKVGSSLPSTQTISTIIGYGQNTTRMALENLSTFGILKRDYVNSKEKTWIVKSLDFSVAPQIGESKVETLVDMVVKDLEDYITNNLKTGDRLPAHSQLSEELKASLKTVHDALSVLISRGILLARRGRYGTTVIKMPNGEISSVSPESSIFASAKDTAFYHYEKTQNYLKKMIATEYEVGDKLPSIQELSVSLDLSPNTIRKAFHNLAKEGYLVFSRGRYGGTFVIDIPELETQAFKWLSVNPQYAKEYQEN
ncbi:MAG: GntR family transcriptional regulator [Muribaculaceae bacterium]|nr:GntR family transcriptional regulator [Muribaculaceae bacterium]